MILTLPLIPRLPLRLRFRLRLWLWLALELDLCRHSRPEVGRVVLRTIPCKVLHPFVQGVESGQHLTGSIPQGDDGIRLIPMWHAVPQILTDVVRERSLTQRSRGRGRICGASDGAHQIQICHHQMAVERLHMQTGKLPAQSLRQRRSLVPQVLVKRRLAPRGHRRDLCRRYALPPGFGNGGRNFGRKPCVNFSEAS